MDTNTVGSNLTSLFGFVDMQSLLLLGLTFCIFGLFFLFAYSQQKRAVNKVDRALVLQEQANQTLNMLLTETRRSNRLLAMLAEMDVQDVMPGESMGEGSAPGADHTGQTKLYVGNIDYAATEAELADLFSPYGKIETVNIPVNRYNGRTRGFGFVTFSTYEEAERAMALNGAEFKGRQIQVNFAREREMA